MNSQDVISNSDSRRPPFLPNHFAQYPEVHRDRLNLLLHALTVPLFMAGTVMLVLGVAPGFPLKFASFGLLVMIAAMGVQGRGHRRETHAPAPFRGPMNVLARIFAEQWITFPRFVVSGGFRQAWVATMLKA